MFHARKRRVSSTAVAATAPTPAGTVVSSGSPTLNNGGKGKGKHKGKGKDKNNIFGGYGNNNRGSNTPVWPSFYNPWMGAWHQ
jgi:hypothetical protein